MLKPRDSDRLFYWRKSSKWYRVVSNTYEYELTDAAPEKARESYERYKSYIDEILAQIGKTPYEGVIIDL
jgi:hypothetical protein